MEDPPAAPAADEAQSLVGQRLSDFELLERIGGGHTRQLYKARQVALGRTVALKLLPEALAGDPAAVERFRAEGQAAAAVHHPNVVDVHWLGCEDGRHFIAREFVDGESLAAVLKREEQLPPDRALAIMRQVASALAALHEAGIIHCGVQPGNILLTPAGQAKLTGFDLARPRDQAAARTTPAALLEYLLYFPPEAARGKRLDERSDLYLLGATFYHALAGRPPFQGESAEERALQYARKDVPRLNQVRPTAPMALCRLIHKLLSRKPADRYASADEVAQALDRIGVAFAKSGKRRAASPEPRAPRAQPRTATAEDRTPSAPPTPAPLTPRPSSARARPARPRSGRAILLAGGGVGLLVVVVLAVLASRGDREEPPPPEPAPAETPSPPAWKPTPLPERPKALTGPIRLTAGQATIHGEVAELEEKAEDGPNVGFWTRPQDWVSWDLPLAEPGTFAVEVEFAADKSAAGNEYTVGIGTQLLKGVVSDSGGWDKFRTETLGTLTVGRVGRVTLSVRPVRIKPKTALMNLREIVLRPVKDENGAGP